MSVVTNFKGQAAQDAFVLWVLKGKRNGYFLEIGSNDPILINNTYLLESEYNWKGIMVEYMSNYLHKYLEHRPTAIHIMEDATQVDYNEVLEQLAPPEKVVDYLQIDLEVINESTIKALYQVEKTMLEGYKYAVVTFEHDIYASSVYDTRPRSREIFERHGYVRVFSDVKNANNPYEDWYVHPDLVDMSRIEQVRTEESLEWTDILERLRQTRS